MQYVLGNMLNGGGGLNADGLSLDLQFAADKTLTARKGPRPDFTRASTGTFVGSNGLIQSAAVNGPRFDHTSAGVCRGLLIEEGRTNTCLQSENFGTTWVNANTTISSNTETSPDGNTTADTATVNNAGTNFLAQQVTVAASTQYTFSFYTKRGSATNATYSVYNNNANNDIVSATSYFSQTSLSAWVRVSFQFTTPVGCTSIFIYVLRNTGSTGTMHFWGAQLEAGSFATSYIPTTTGSVVRSADVCSITGGAFSNMWNATEGTIFAAHYQYESSTFGAILTADPTADPGKIQIGRNGTTQVDLAIKDNANVIVFNYNPVSSLISGRNKSAIAYKQNDSIATINNLSSPLDASVTLGTQTQLLIGNDSVGSGRRHNGAIDSIRVYKKRLPLAKLQALTA